MNLYSLLFWIAYRSKCIFFVILGTHGLFSSYIILVVELTNTTSPLTTCPPLDYRRSKVMLPFAVQTSIVELEKRAF
ncbi:hypothetical protein AQUCO_07100015v1 [Aquilegia coerulea]|uniref:Uncharacterized protein n=1 Tax=Aquilegia coerulea TaxID=218851 RepID=A0A2G5CAN8_AQUCA|nr:hypothetical protein AQUCO_07100015v1 [Aquilegia coerulea]